MASLKPKFQEKEIVMTTKELVGVTLELTLDEAIIITALVGYATSPSWNETKRDILYSLYSKLDDGLGLNNQAGHILFEGCSNKFRIGYPANMNKLLEMAKTKLSQAATAFKDKS